MGGADAARRECRPRPCHQWQSSWLRQQPCFFPDDKGYYAYVNIGGKARSSCRTRTWCASVARPPTPTATTRSLRPPMAGYDMPPLATVTLEKVEQPGEWEVCGHKVQRRLFTVSVTYK